MLLKFFYDKALAHASYLVGCQKTGEAIVVDAGRDVQQYLDVAKSESMKIVGVADTHIHADYVSGARQLAEQVGAKLYVSDEGSDAWKFEFASAYDHELLRDGDVFRIGKIEFLVMHTPGHTPESISFVLTDCGGGANEPMGIFTGDFVFVGSIGRPDLLEEAAGVAGTAEPGARDLFQSIQRFRELPEFMQVWPSHGAGSACGKGLGAIPSSTVGYEKRFNPAFQFDSEDDFVDYVLAEQPEAPKYFAVMKRVNRVGPTIIPSGDAPAKLNASELARVAEQHMVIDTRPAGAFANGHATRTVNIPLKYLAAWGGWLVDYSQAVYLIAAERDIDEANRVLRKIGIEQIGGYFEVREVANSFAQTYEERTPKDLADQIENHEVILVDVRGDSEWNESHIARAQRSFLGRLPERLAERTGDCTLVFQCRSGGRSAIAASLAKAAGVEDVINMVGGIQAWEAAGLATESTDTACCGPTQEATTHEVACQTQAVYWNGACPVPTGS